jgi:hypothetical protein
MGPHLLVLGAIGAEGAWAHTVWVHMQVWAPPACAWGRWGRGGSGPHLDGRGNTGADQTSTFETHETSLRLHPVSISSRGRALRLVPLRVVTYALCTARPHRDLPGGSIPLLRWSSGMSPGKDLGTSSQTLRIPTGKKQHGHPVLPRRDKSRFIWADRDGTFRPGQPNWELLQEFPGNAAKQRFPGNTWDESPFFVSNCGSHNAL